MLAAESNEYPLVCIPKPVVLVFVIAPLEIVPVIEMVLSRFKVTAPEVPPPFKLVPALTEVMSPVPPPPTAEPLK